MIVSLHERRLRAWVFGITLWKIYTLDKHQRYHDNIMGDQEVFDSA